MKPSEILPLKRKSLREKIKDLQKIWRDGDSHLSRRRSHNRGCCRGDHQRFEIHGQSIRQMVLKTVGAKAASALPGLIGAIVSFLFKTAGQAIGYLAEHTWLLDSRGGCFHF